MLSGLIAAGGKALGGARFSLISVMPGFLVISVIAVLMRAQLYAPSQDADFGAVLPTSKDAFATTLFVLLAFIGGVLLRPFEMAVIQLLEGYWTTPSPLAPLHGAAVERHRRRRYRALVNIDHADGTNSDWGVTEPTTGAPGRIGARPLAELAAMDRAAARRARGVARARRVRRGYPVETRELDVSPTFKRDPQGELLPTLLGNALLRGERLSGDRYGLDMPVVGPRLFPFISPRLQAAVNQQLDLISASASLCVALAVVTLATLPLLVRLDVWSLLPLAPAVVAALAYRGAVAASLHHGTLLCTVFDLHRYDLIKAFHYKIPEDVRSITELNRMISQFLATSNTDRLEKLGELRNQPMDHPSDDQDVLQRGNGNGPA
jgi:hypothetical protein